MYVRMFRVYHLWNEYFINFSSGISESFDSSYMIQQIDFYADASL